LTKHKFFAIIMILSKTKMSEEPTYTRNDLLPDAEKEGKRPGSLRRAGRFLLKRAGGRELRRSERVKDLHNDIKELPGAGVLETPDQEAIGRAQAEDPRIGYLPLTTDPDYLKAVEEMDGGSTNPLESNYQKAIRLHLTRKLKREREEFPQGDRLGVRAVQVSINGSIHQGETTVMDVVDIARLGKEHEHDRNVIRLVPVNEKGVLEKGLNGVYAEKNGQFRERMQPTGRAHAIFPALIIYDLDRLKHVTAEGYEDYGWVGDAGEAVLAVYVTDAPQAGVPEITARSEASTTVHSPRSGSYDSRDY
jgi:hypothetical protein